ncbi:hypothetical protein [Wenyingzhuangia sp. 2_MG-2023]|nr:hypothetical protein [Wenyingzhuangia sp. 2_MG-2023]MDO6736498.1 hypothetical protein [Wenyingzhuangia sp. 2_MG-2023]
MPDKEYKIIKELKAQDLHDKINDEAKKGFHVKGSLLVFNDYLTVLMVK